jgi:7-cyano-7-deazaguanine reductase
MSMDAIAQQSPLGKASAYCADYNPALLFPISRQFKRDEIGIVATHLPFRGIDVWTAYELSWLNPKGKPMVALAEFVFPADSPNIIESKSFKLYLNSFNGTRFDTQAQVAQQLQQDLTQTAGAPVKVKILPIDREQKLVGDLEEAMCLDHQDIAIEDYQLNPEQLKVGSEHVEETLYSHLLKSNCLVTGQPDWATLVIKYRGKRIDRAGLLRYIVSFRNHNEFHEQCVERIFSDIEKYCRPDVLTVYARYVRRGGLDINPFRSNFQSHVDMPRFVRQ